MSPKATPLCGTRPAFGGHADRSSLLGFIDLSEPRHPLAGRSRCRQAEGVHAVKKLLLLALVGLGVVAAWRKVQADRAELDLWTEATTSDD
jgi:hypothetical protein